VNSVRQRFLIATVAAAWSCAAPGCGQRNTTARYVPAPQQAEAAIKLAFDAWKQGAAAGPVAGSMPAVHVTDSYRRPDERLVAYEILGEVPGDTPRCYAVSLQFDSAREEKARFVVVGVDPLWVFRLEDLQLLNHWEHRMEPESNAAAGSDEPGAAP
jgi:hypothetical protein